MKTDMQEYLKTAGPEADGDQAPTSTVDVDSIADAAAETVTIEPQVQEAAKQMLLALGGIGNLRKIEAVAFTRLRVELADATKFNEEGAKMAGVAAVMQIVPDVLHLIIGDKAGQFAQAMNNR
jgi:PTS system glucose-specific IIC component